MAIGYGTWDLKKKDERMYVALLSPPQPIKRKAHTICLSGVFNAEIRYSEEKIFWF